MCNIYLDIPNSQWVIPLKYMVQLLKSERCKMQRADF